MKTLQEAIEAGKRIYQRNGDEVTIFTTSGKMKLFPVCGINNETGCAQNWTAEGKAVSEKVISAHDLVWDDGEEDNQDYGPKTWDEYYYGEYIRRKEVERREEIYCRIIELAAAYGASEEGIDVFAVYEKENAIVVEKESRQTHTIAFASEKVAKAFAGNFESMILEVKFR